MPLQEILSEMLWEHVKPAVVPYCLDVNQLTIYLPLWVQGKPSKIYCQNYT